MTEITDFVNAINQSGGLKIQMVAATDPNQFLITTAIGILGCIIILVWYWQLIQPKLAFVYAAIKLRSLTKLTGRHALIIKHTRNGLFNISMINTNTLESIRKALYQFKGKPFDLILHTPGGSIFATQLISKLLRTYPTDIRAIIPSYAMSGGSFLALSCDEILLADTASLGAIDPQLGYLWHSGSAKSWDEVIKKKHSKANDESIQMAYEGKQYSETLYNQMNKILEDKIHDNDLRASTAKFLTDGHIEHARPLMIDDLKQLNIPVKDVPTDIMKLIEPILFNNTFEGVYWK